MFLSLCKNDTEMLSTIVSRQLNVTQTVSLAHYHYCKAHVLHNLRQSQVRHNLCTFVSRSQ